jgi:dihydropteroate synthase
MNLLNIGNKNFKIGKQTIIMGVLNVTPDSFSDGGKFFSVDDAINHAIKMEKEGADIIDIGGESTRPGSKSVSLNEEMNRIIPVLEELVKKIKIPISIDTYKSEIAKKTLELGASMINDITALHGDKNLAKIVSDYKVPICLMHMKGEPKNMQVNPTYTDVVKEIHDFLKERSDYAISSGIKKNKIIIDPGLGFGKRTGKGIEDNCEIIKRLSEFKDLGYPIIVGASRKTFIGNISGDKKTLPFIDRLEGSLAAVCVSIANGADIVRVHDLKETRRCIDIVDCIIR